MARVGLRVTTIYRYVATGGFPEAPEIRPLFPLGHRRGK